MKGEWDGLPTDVFASQRCFGVSLNEVNETKLDLEHRYLLLGTAFLMVSNYFEKLPFTKGPLGY